MKAAIGILLIALGGYIDFLVITGKLPATSGGISTVTQGQLPTVHNIQSGFSGFQAAQIQANYAGSNAATFNGNYKGGQTIA